MILVPSSIPMGRMYHSNTRIRGLKEAIAAVVLIQHESGDFTYGVGVLHPDVDHLYFKESKTLDSQQLWFGMYAASRLSCVSDQTLAVAISIADTTIKIDDPQFTSDSCCLRYGYDAPMLRAETLAQEPPQDEIKKIVAEFKRWHLPINDPFAKVPEKEEPTSAGSFHRIMGIGIGVKSLSLGI